MTMRKSRNICSSNGLFQMLLSMVGHLHGCGFYRNGEVDIFLISLFSCVLYVSKSSHEDFQVMPFFFQFSLASRHIPSFRWTAECNTVNVLYMIVEIKKEKNSCFWCKKNECVSFGWNDSCLFFSVCGSGCKLSELSSVLPAPFTNSSAPTLWDLHIHRSSY